MPRGKRKNQRNFDWELVTVRPDAPLIESVRAWRKKNDMQPFELVEAIVGHQIKLAISNDTDNDTYIVTVTPKGPRYEDLKTSFVFRNDDLLTVLWLVGYHCALDQWDALAETPTTDNWRL